QGAPPLRIRPQPPHFLCQHQQDRAPALAVGVHRQAGAPLVGEREGFVCGHLERGHASSPSARAARRTRKAAFTSLASTARGTASEKVHSPSLLYSPSGLAG